jgi:hypothetical protein
MALDTTEVENGDNSILASKMKIDLKGNTTNKNSCTVYSLLNFQRKKNNL